MKTLKNSAFWRFLRSFLSKKFPLFRCSPWILVWKKGKGRHSQTLVICEFVHIFWSSLFYNTSTTQMTRMRHESNTSAIRVLHERLECDTSATRVKKFGFDNNTCDDIFSYPYISYMANERLQREEQFHSKNYLLRMSRSHAKMRLKSALQKLNFVMAKAISKGFTLDCSCKCPCTFPHSYS